MTRLGKWLLLMGGLVGLAGGAALVWYHLPVPQRYFTDADTIRTPTTEVTPRDVLWQPPRALSEVLNTEREDFEPRLSWDGLTLYFVRGKAGENAEIFQATRTPTGWTAAEPLAAVNSEYDELGPEPAPDGQALYFYSDRPGGVGGYDLWVVRRGTDGWLPATNLGPAVNSPFNDYGPAVTPDGGSLYFASNRPRKHDAVQSDPAAWRATVREEIRRRTYDLYRATLTDAGTQPAIAVDQLNTPANEGAPCVSPAGDFLYFASDRPGGAGGFDLYRARRLGAEHTAIVNLGAPVNTPANELDPGLTHLGYALYFSRDSRPPPGAAAKRSDYDLYVTTAREVFAETESYRRPPLAWAQLWPALLWLLLALAALVALRLLAGGMRDGTLGLLARCLIASLTAHALVMLALSFWQVGSALAEGLRHGRVHIVLAAPRDGDALAAQICAALTQFDTPAIVTIEPPRSTPVLAAALPVTLAVVAPVQSEQRIPEQSPVQVAARDAAPPQQPMVATDVPLDTGAALTELAVPAEARRVATVEPQSIPALDPHSDSLLPRCTIAVPTSRPACDTPLRDAAEEAGPMAVALADAQSLIGEPQTRDAPATRSARADLPPPLEPQPPTFDIALPNEPRAAAVREPDAVLPPTADSAATAARRAVPLPPVDAPNAQVELDLPPAPEDSSGFALVSADEPIVRDAPPPTRRVQASPPVAPRATHLPLAEMAVPVSVTEHTAAAAELPVHVESVDPPTAPRPALRGLVSTLNPIETAVPSDAAPTPGRGAGSADALPAPGIPRDADPTTPAIRDRAVSAPAAALPLALGLPTGTEAQEGEEAIGTIHGRVLDAQTAAPLSGVTVRLDVPDGEPLVAQTDTRGHYTLAVLELPEHVALSASLDGYVPATASVPAWRLRRTALEQDFELEPQTDEIVVIEPQPEVHHLGNDRWEGRINSQFQKRAEGRILRAYIELSAEQLPPIVRSAQVSLLAKGVQCPHRILINGHLLDRRLDRAPADGSFGEFAAPFDPTLLTEGVNVLEIRAVSCRGDLDDFELVNLQLHLSR